MVSIVKILALVHTYVGHTKKCKPTGMEDVCKSYFRPSILWKFSRWEISHCIQIITGHCYYAKHRNLLGEDISPICRICGVRDETPFHLAFECSYLNDHRSQFNLSQNDWTYGSILHFFEDEDILQYQYC